MHALILQTGFSQGLLFHTLVNITRRYYYTSGHSVLVGSHCGLGVIRSLEQS